MFAFRIGIFFTIVGLVLFIFFSLSLVGGSYNLWVCGGAAICLIFGLWIAIINRPLPPEANRFRTINKFYRRGRNDKP